MKLSRISVSTAAVAILACGVALWPANAQPAGGGGGGAQPPAGGRPQPRGDRPAGDGPGAAGGSEWREKLKDEIRDHPRMGRALLALHEAKDYLEKATGDFGGHKASSIKSCDDAIKELTEAIKFDEKRAEPAGGRPGRPNGGKPGDGKPGDTKPGDAPAAPAKP